MRILLIDGRGCSIDRSGWLIYKNMIKEDFGRTWTLAWFHCCSLQVKFRPVEYLSGQQNEFQSIFSSKHRYSAVYVLHFNT